MEVTPLPTRPQGTMVSKSARSVATFNAKPWWVTHRLTPTPIAATFSRPTQTPVAPATRSATIPQAARAPMRTSSRSRR